MSSRRTCQLSGNPGVSSRHPSQPAHIMATASSSALIGRGDVVRHHKRQPAAGHRELVDPPPQLCRARFSRRSSAPPASIDFCQRSAAHCCTAFPTCKGAKASHWMKYGLYRSTTERRSVTGMKAPPVPFCSPRDTIRSRLICPLFRQKHRALFPPRPSFSFSWVSD